MLNFKATKIFLQLFLIASNIRGHAPHSLTSQLINFKLCATKQYHTYFHIVYFLCSGDLLSGGIHPPQVFSKFS